MSRSSSARPICAAASNVSMTVSAGRAARLAASSDNAAKSCGATPDEIAAPGPEGGGGAPLPLPGSPRANARSSLTTLGALAGVPAARGARSAERCGVVGRSATRSIGSQELQRSGKNNAPSGARSLERRRSKVRRRIAEFCNVTHLARSVPLAPPCAEIRLARELCPESRILALRAAIAEGRYRIDSQAIALKLIAAIDPHFQPVSQH